MAYPSALYNNPIPDLKTQLHKSIAKGLSQRKQNSSSTIFFRADDIGVPSNQFKEMVSLFLHHKVPLCLAVVPAWLSQTRLDALQQVTGTSSQFCWHQHGWLHRNYELSGKKQEFGSIRSEEHIRQDLVSGQKRLTKLLDNHFSLFFTPPWNRCSTSTLKLLKKLQYKGVSRSRGASPLSPENLPDFQVNVDLHTRNEINTEDSLQYLLGEITTSLSSGFTGVMLHHQRMNSNAFHLLDLFLQVISEFREIESVHFDEMI
jgi:hypothetical protein